MSAVNKVFAFVDEEARVLDIRAGHQLSPEDLRFWLEISNPPSLYGLALHNQDGVPLYKMVGSELVRREVEEVYPLAEVKSDAVIKIKRLAGVALARTDYVVLRQFDPKDKNRLSDSDFELVQARRRALRDLSNDYEAEVMKAESSSAVATILAMVENEPTVRG